MRKALTLIELIFSMVIIAVVFTVIPKLIQSFAITNEVVIKEDALYNAMSLMGIVTSLPWDNNNSEEDYVLNVNTEDSNFTCRSDGYRIGGFVGGRNCIGISGNSATLKADFNESDGFFNDIDDYHNFSTTTFDNCEPNLYKMDANVTYVYDINGSTANLNETTNTKNISIKINYSPNYKKNKYRGKCITTINYKAYNIGQIQINKRAW